MSDAARILTGRLHKAEGVGYGEPVALSQDETRAVIALYRAISGAVILEHDPSRTDEQNSLIYERARDVRVALAEADRRFREGDTETPA